LRSFGNKYFDIVENDQTISVKLLNKELSYYNQELNTREALSPFPPERVSEDFVRSYELTQPRISEGEIFMIKHYKNHLIHRSEGEVYLNGGIPFKTTLVAYSTGDRSVREIREIQISDGMISESEARFWPTKNFILLLEDSRLTVLDKNGLELQQISINGYPVVNHDDDTFTYKNINFHYVNLKTGSTRNLSSLVPDLNSVFISNEIMVSISDNKKTLAMIDLKTDSELASYSIFDSEINSDLQPWLESSFEYATINRAGHLLYLVSSKTNVNLFCQD